MSDRILAYFAPETPKSSKRKIRSSISPDGSTESTKRVQLESESMATAPDMSKKILEMTCDEFFRKLDAKLEKLASKEDLCVLNEKIELLQKENQSLQEEISRLKRRDEETRLQIEDIVNRSRRNNIIFRGVQVADNDYVKSVKNFCTGVLGCKQDLVVNRAHPLRTLRRDNNALLIAHIPRDEDINDIFKNVKKLKGTGYVIHRDYSRDVREKRNFLLKIKKAVEEFSETVSARLVYDHLFVNNTRYDWDLVHGLRAGREDGCLVLGATFNHNFKPLVENLLKKNNEPPQGKKSTKNEVSTQ